MLAEDGFDELARLARLDALASNRDLQFVLFCERRKAELGGAALRPPRLLGGTDLIAMGYSPGPRLGEILGAVGDAQLDGAIKTREDAEAFVRDRYPS